MPSLSSSSHNYYFPAEHLLTESPPNYDTERTYTLVYLIVSFIFFAVILPALLAKPIVVDKKKGNGEEEQNKEETQSTTTTATNGSKTTTTSSSGKKKNTRNKKGQKQEQQSNNGHDQQQKEDEPPIVEYEINPITTMYCVFWFVLSVEYILLKYSPDNYYTPRSVFEAPLFTVDECNKLLQMANVAAQINYENAKIKYKELQLTNQFKQNILGTSGGSDNSDGDGSGDDASSNSNGHVLLGDNNYDYLDVDEEDEIIAVKDNLDENKTIMGLLSEPYGWQKTRHGIYPTTDLNIITDPFTKSDRMWIQNILNSRLTPLIERIYGIPATSIRANDMFVVRYDADKRNHLAKHTDDGSISFNVLLNDDFDDGGTRFWNRLLGEPFAHVNPKQIGQVLLNSAMIQHEGMHITRGTRTIFVGFLSVDRYDPFSFSSSDNDEDDNDDDNDEEDGALGEGRGPPPAAISKRRKAGGTYTGLSWWASWGSLAWCTRKFKDGYQAAEARINVLHEESWMNHGWVRSLFHDVFHVLTWLGDVFEPHRSVNLVDAKHRDEYIKLLDQYHQHNEQQKERQQQQEEGEGVSRREKKKQRHRRDGAVWFEGQQINTDITGELNAYWQTRLLNKHRFTDSEL